MKLAQSATPTPAAVHHARSVPECFSGCDGHHCAWEDRAETHPAPQYLTLIPHA
ncbi:Uncharacterised protein [Vibrio cholerae]|nr:Uncharacterised protein [Vibrio cholerae]